MNLIKRIKAIFKKPKKPTTIFTYKLIDSIIKLYIQQAKYKSFIVYIRKIGMLWGSIGLATIPIAIAIAIILYSLHISR